MSEKEKTGIEKACANKTVSDHAGQDSLIWVHIVCNIGHQSKEEQKTIYSKTCVKQPFSKRPKIGFQDQLLLYAGAFCNTFDLHFATSCHSDNCFVYF